MVKTKLTRHLCKSIIISASTTSSQTLRIHNAGNIVCNFVTVTSTHAQLPPVTHLKLELKSCSVSIHPITALHYLSYAQPKDLSCENWSWRYGSTYELITLYIRTYYRNSKPSFQAIKIENGINYKILSRLNSICWKIWVHWILN